MAATVIARDTDEFYRTPQGKAFCREYLATKWLDTITGEDRLVDYIKRNRSLLPILRLADKHGATLYGIKLEPEQRITALFFKTANDPTQGLRLMLELTGGVYALIGAQAAKELEQDTARTEPAPAFTAMLQDIQKHTFREKRIAQLA